MFAKTKKFVKDHNTQIKTFCDGVAVGCLIMFVATRSDVNGWKLTGADLFHDVMNDVDFLHVTFKNGKSKDYLWEFKK